MWITFVTASKGSDNPRIPAFNSTKLRAIKNKSAICLAVALNCQPAEINLIFQVVKLKTGIEAEQSLSILLVKTLQEFHQYAIDLFVLIFNGFEAIGVTGNLIKVGFHTVSPN